MGNVRKLRPNHSPPPSPSRLTRSGRGALAGALAAALWAAQQPLDKRVFGFPFDDVELLGKAVTSGPHWRAAGMAMHLANGAALHVREHQFLAATGNIDYTWELNKGVSNILFGGTGFFIDKFHGAHGEGILWLHGYGNVFEKVLAPGEEIDVEPGAWLYKDPSVRMTTNVQRLSTGIFAGMNLTMNRFSGPGRLGLQSMYLAMETGDT